MTTDEKSGLSRRSLLQAGIIAGIAVYLAPVSSSAGTILGHACRGAGAGPTISAAQVRARIDGIAKLTGAKIFARDLRSRDLAGWPQAQAHAFLLRATRTDRIFEGVELAGLGKELQPDRIVTAEDLARDGILLPEFYGKDMLLPEGAAPQYLGHAVALCIYQDLYRYLIAKRRITEQRLAGNDAILRYGEKAEVRQSAPYGGVRVVRVASDGPDEPDLCSALQDGLIFPVLAHGKLHWPSANAQSIGPARSMHFAEEISARLAMAPEDWFVIDNEYASQSTDMAALEADNSNGWYDPEERALHLVVATQSPTEIAENAAPILAASRFEVSELILHPCCTVGYGTKDHSTFPYYGLVAALYGGGTPVRLALDRYEHFQSALKRHPLRIRSSIAVDRYTGKFEILKTEAMAQGGGRPNLSQAMAVVGATATQSLYYFPTNDITCIVRSSAAVEAGSARGFGALQMITATELLVDEVAEALAVDPITLRLGNLIESGMPNSQGAIPAGMMRQRELLERAQAHKLWQQRQERKRALEKSNGNILYGVGFACAQKDFGCGAEAVSAAIALDADGTVNLHHVGVELGTGSLASLAILCADWLGRPADRVEAGRTDWSPLAMISSGDPWRISQHEQDRAAQDPRWTPRLHSTSAASNSAYYFSHTTGEAARLVFHHGIWPAALSIWSEGRGGGQAGSYFLRREYARWTAEGLTLEGLEPLRLERLAKRAHEREYVTGAMVHSFNRWAWAEADFTILGEKVRLPLDGVALRFGPGRKNGSLSGFERLVRENVAFPPVRRNDAAVTYYTPAATLIELTVDRLTGEVSILSHHSVLECGRMLVPEHVSGQLQGGIAMAIGHALYEELPLDESGPGNGCWNLDRYPLPRARDVAVWTQTAEFLAPLSDTDPCKGVGEVVMIPAIAATLNAIAHATGHRFRETPVTPARIREALL